VWACLCFALILAVEMTLISEAVRVDRRRRAAYMTFLPRERLAYLQSIGWPGLLGINLAALSTLEAARDHWHIAEVAFALEAAVLILGAAWTRRLLRAMRD
jgi:hypothetical protein